MDVKLATGVSGDSRTYTLSCCNDEEKVLKVTASTVDGMVHKLMFAHSISVPDDSGEVQTYRELHEGMTS